MGLIDEAIELNADAYEEMLTEYKKIKYNEIITKEFDKDEKGL